MGWLQAVLLGGSLSACAQLGLPQDSGAAGAVGSGTAGAGSSAEVIVRGTNCGLDPGSGVSLCLGISSCPTVRVDPDQFPDCGYRIAGSTIDLECLCGDSLCPMGTAASCLDAKSLLSEQSAQGVCAAIADGRCQVVQHTSIHSNSTCDPECRAQCSGVPGCITLCGC
jgi:hypothetical protein